MVKIIESEYKYGVLIRFDGVNGSIYDAIEYSYVLSKIDKTRLIICNNSNIDDTVLYNLFLDLISKNYSEQKRVCYHHLHCRSPPLSWQTTWLRISRCSCRALCSPFKCLSTSFPFYFSLPANRKSIEPGSSSLPPK